jgi:hypothetical protein
MLMVLLQWLCGEVWQSAFCYLWEQRICQCVCSLVYIYITATKSRADCSLWLSISDNLYTCLMAHSFYMTKQFNFLPFFHTSNNIWWQAQFIKLYIMQFPITFSHKSLRTEKYQHCTQTQFTVYSQCHRPSVTPTSIKTLHKHTHLYFNKHASRKQEEKQTILKL